MLHGMKSDNHTLILFFSLMIFGLSLCQKALPQTSDNVESKNQLPLRITYFTLKHPKTLLFTYNNQNQITAISITSKDYNYADKDHNGTFVCTFTYENNALAKIEWGDKQTGKIFIRKNISLGKDSVVLATTEYNEGGDLVLYQNRQLYKLNNLSLPEVLIDELLKDSTIYNYDNYGRMVSMTRFLSGHDDNDNFRYYPDQISSYSDFDDKKGLFCNINMPQWILQLLDLPRCTINNYSKMTDTYPNDNNGRGYAVNSTFTYIYNNQGYPVKIRYKDDDFEDSLIDIEYIDAK